MVMVRSIAPPLAVPDQMLDGMRFAVPSTGVVLGRDGAGNPVQASLFGPAPATAAFIGGWWALQLLVLRSLAIGAVLVIDAIDTDAPAREGTLAGLRQWLMLGRLVERSGPARPGRGAGHAVRPATAEPAVATADRPILYVHDRGPGGPSDPPSPAPWQTCLTVLARVTPSSHGIIEAADVVLAQRLDPREAALVASARLLAPEFTREVGAMDHETIVASRGRAVRYVRLCPTSVERQYFG